MPRYLVLGLCLLAPIALAESDDHDLAYSLGASLGERLRQDMPGLQLDALVDGLRQSYQGQPLKLDNARMQAVLQQHEAQEGDAETQKLQASEKRFMANERGRYGVRELTQGILYSELQAGTGAQPKPGGKVQVRYVGKLPDGSIFDQNQAPQWFSLDSVIEGWQLALPLMHAGAKWRLVIPSAQAYGAEGAGDLIAPYTPLVFEIELLAVGD
ncbi:FKBP-type peptidyl-prolyl cis-trans isomerase [Pseudomonas sp. DCB_BI]|uniref:FKBP-type peptidyl-prolyl cis-trans isomerase n=1 Tax=Pseudomonas sp. DCB_BI TaxID=2993594 RepID=UPI00224B0A51|nr:FKBP-type peptidyl-prolyl cis-trans isomerase [Pseudomonas sp. DCB_BI]MCX2891343.1 FKBP-type peptidyl-prolyl cis-trans isomerase [Pseudomonas sp. DCB_BI]